MVMVWSSGMTFSSCMSLIVVESGRNVQYLKGYLPPATEKINECLC